MAIEVLLKPGTRTLYINIFTPEKVKVYYPPVSLIKTLSMLECRHSVIYRTDNAREVFRNSPYLVLRSTLALWDNTIFIIGIPGKLKFYLMRTRKSAHGSTKYFDVVNAIVVRSIRYSELLKAMEEYDAMGFNHYSDNDMFINLMAYILLKMGKPDYLVKEKNPRLVSLF